MPAIADKEITSLFPPGRFEFVPEEPLSEDEFFELCQRADPLQLERDPDGTVIVSSPAGSYSSHRSNEISSQLRNWTAEQHRGAALDSSGGFTLPNGATRAPDAAWVSPRKLSSLSSDQKRKFLPVAPDFAVEVRSPNDARTDLEAKMKEYIENGTRLGWLIDPEDESVTVYREDGSMELLEKPSTLSGESVLPGFECDLERVWNPGF